MNKINMNGYTRVNKSVARKMFNEGKSLYFCPAKIIPGGSFGMGMLIDPKRWKEDCCEGEQDAFEKACQNFAYYNCSSETGYYPAFYKTNG
jgi:hypothetical protein